MPPLQFSSRRQSLNARHSISLDWDRAIEEPVCLQRETLNWLKGEQTGGLMCYLSSLSDPRPRPVL